MRKLIAVAALGALVALPQAAFAGNTDTATVTFEVQAINEIAISGDPGPLVVNAATAGSEPTAATADATTSYAITTNEDKKITAAIDANMPAGVVLSLTAVAPTGGISGGKKALSTTAADIVTGVSKVVGSNLLLTYDLSATVAAGVVGSDTRTVTLTIAAP